MAQAIKWHGGKHYLADWILSHAPEHVHYCEPFFGGGAVLFRKEPEGYSEAVNDVCHRLMNFWRVLADPAAFQDFHNYVSTMPFSEELFEHAQRISRQIMPEDCPQWELAAYFFVVARQSRQGLGRAFATTSRRRTRCGMNEQVASWLGAIDGLVDVHQRLRRVVLFCKPALDVIRSQDGEQTWFYCDPPYPHETRTAADAYEYEMAESDHIALLEALAGIEGKFALSSYPNPLYDEFARACGWAVDYREIDNKASSRPTKETKIEALYMNYEGVG